MAPRIIGGLTGLGPALLLSLLPGIGLRPVVHASILLECSSSVPPVLRHPILDVSDVCQRPIDDSNTDPHQPVNYSPWTHVPVCDVSVISTNKKYCVYTNSRHGHRGLSLLVSPETAADSVSILDEHLNATEPGVGPFEIVDIPGKGKGMVATRHIRRYEQILVDYSVLLVDTSFASEVPADRGYRLLQAAVDRLADPDSVRGLGMSSDMAQDPVENVLRTNAFHTLLGGVQHMALYPVVSRINHGCMPNAYTRFNPHSLQTVSVAAAKDIQPGEEITISYIILGKTHAERQSALQQWGFKCTCPLCTAPPNEIAQSDARRTQIESLRDQAISAFQAGRTYQSLRITRQILNLLPREELFPSFAEHYENMARIYFVLRDKENAYKYARISLEVLLEQGYIDRVREEHFHVMFSRFAQEEAGRF